jgi:putative ABC transport system permease protein
VQRFILLLVRNLGRNKLRTSLTGMAIVVLMAIYTFTFAVTDKVNRLVGAHSSQNRLMIREKWVMPSRFPIRYVPAIANLEGIEDWTPWNFYGGYLDDAGHTVAGIATRIDNLREMHPGLENLDPALLERMQQEKDAVLMGPSTLQQMNWQVGQKFTVTSYTHPGKNLQFHVIGVLPSDLWSRNYFFRQDYYQEATGDHEDINILWVRTTDADAAKRLSGEIEQLFDNAREKLRAETESAGVGRLMGRAAALVNILNFVVVILLIDIVAVLANSISMTVRERRREVAILKILGFQPRFVLMMVIGEAMLVGAAGGMIGGGAAYLLATLNSADCLPMRIEFLVEFPVGLKFVFQGLLVGMLVGFVGSVIPAWSAQKISVIEAFSKAG